MDTHKPMGSGSRNTSTDATTDRETVEDPLRDEKTSSEEGRNSYLDPDEQIDALGEEDLSKRIQKQVDQQDQRKGEKLISGEPENMGEASRNTWAEESMRDMHPSEDSLTASSKKPVFPPDE